MTCFSLVQKFWPRHREKRATEDFFDRDFKVVKKY